MSLNTRIYLASSYARKDEMRVCRDVIQAAGYTVVSRWIDNEGGYATSDVTYDQLQNEPDAARDYAVRDLQDILDSNIFIMFTGDNQSSGGRHTEYGVAMALDMYLIIIGPRENVFQCNPKVLHYPTWRAFCHALWDGIAIVHAEQLIRDLVKGMNTES